MAEEDEDDELPVEISPALLLPLLPALMGTLSLDFDLGRVLVSTRLSRLRSFPLRLMALPLLFVVVCRILLLLTSFSIILERPLSSSVTIFISDFSFTGSTTADDVATAGGGDTTTATPSGSKALFVEGVG